MPNYETAAVAGYEPAGEQDLRQANASGSLWRLRNWPLRSKLAVVLVVPLLAALVFGGMNVADQAKQAEGFHHTVDQLDLATHVTAVVNELQAERSLAIARMSNGPVDRAQLEEQFGRADRAMRGLRTAVGDYEPPDEETASRYDQALQRLDAVAPLREKITRTAFSDMFAFSTYNSIIEEFVRLSRDVRFSGSDRELLRAGTTLHALGEAKEYVGRQAAALQIAAGRGNFPADMLEQTFGAQASARAALTSFNSSANLQEQELYAGTVSGTQVDSWERVAATAFAQAANAQEIEIDRGALTGDSASTVTKMYEVETGLLSMMRAKADNLATDATVALWLFAAFAVAVLIAALLLTLMVARAMLRSLRVLRTNALDVAYVRLPESVRTILDSPDPAKATEDAVDPVPVDSSDEIGEVARSFDVVHQRAVRMAAEQAVLRNNVNGIFVNLSRRSQRLVEQQLSVIDQLESDEQDPDQLAHLFELDHLATRLRRNGESLLVLSGEGLTKPMSKPVPAADVIGASVSEIEQYARVDVEGIPDVGVQGRSVHDLVHLTAELLDNATYFSPPETRVRVSATLNRRNELLLSINDTGLGMDEDALIAANERLADPPDLDVSVTHRMGLYVVARLAKQHGIAVRLQAGEGGRGVAARVVVPPQLLTGVPADGELPAALPPRPRKPGELFSPPDAGRPSANERSGAWPSLTSSNPSWPSLTDASLPPLPPLTDSSPYLPQIRDFGEDVSEGAQATTRMPRPTPPPSQPPSPYPANRDTTSYLPPPPEAEPTSFVRPQPTPRDPRDPYDSHQAYEGYDEQGQFGYPAEAASQDGGGDGDGGLRPLAKPISLDDLVGGNSKAAGPFLSPPGSGSSRDRDPSVRRSPSPRKPDRPSSPQYDEPLWPQTHSTGVNPAVPAETSMPAMPSMGDYPLEMPKDEPQYVPVSSESAPYASPRRDRSNGDDGSALEEEGPTRRLPIYQSVVSRWFSVEDSLEDAAHRDAGGTRAGPSDGSSGTPESAVTGGNLGDGWYSASDQGWQAAHAAHEPKGEETTTAGLPKRRPNAYLVPGSIQAPEPSEPAHRVEESSEAAGQSSMQGSSVSRSAEDARSRMKSFQRGYQSGRHALNETSAEDAPADAMTSTPNAFSSWSSGSGANGTKE